MDDSSSPSATLLNNLQQLVPNATERASVRSAQLEHISLGQAQNGVATLTVAGRPLCSGLDPLKEAQTWAEHHQGKSTPDFFVVYGLGMAHHIEALRRMSSAFILVVEPMTQVIAATLAQRPLALDRTLIFADAGGLARWLSRRLMLGNVVEVAAWPPTRRYFPAGLDSIRGAIVNATEMARLNINTLEVRLGVWVEHVLGNLVRSVDRVPATALRTLVAGRPAIIVSAGPSLSQNVEQLRQVEGRATIVAVNTSLRALEVAQVKADLVVAVESLDVSSQLRGLTLNANCPRVLSLTASPKLHETTEARVFPFAEALQFFSSLVERAGFDEPIALGGSVSNAAFSLLCQLGASSIILVGQDLAFSDGRAYARGTVFEDIAIQIDGQRATLTHLEAKRQIAASRPEIDTTRVREELFWVEGWGGGRVPTTNAYNYFRCVFEEQASQLEGIALINATEGGARIQGFIEQPIRDVIASLPPADSRSLPDSPRLERERIAEAFAAECAAAQLVRHVAHSCAASPGPNSRLQIKEAVSRSGLIHACSWSTMLGLMRNPEADLVDLYRQIAVAAEQLAEQLKKQKKMLKPERDPSLIVYESSEQPPE